MEFERQVRRHKDAVYRQMLRVCGNAEDAEDVLLEAIVKGFQRADTLDDPTAFRTWLTTIGKRVCFRLKERNSRLPSSSLEALEAAGVPMPAETGPTAEERMEVEQMHKCVMDAFEALPENYKDVYRMREIQGMSAESTASTLGLTVPNVKSRLHRARRLVREALDKAVCE